MVDIYKRSDIPKAINKIIEDSCVYTERDIKNVADSWLKIAQLGNKLQFNSFGSRGALAGISNLWSPLSSPDNSSDEDTYWYEKAGLKKAGGVYRQAYRWQGPAKRAVDRTRAAVQVATLRYVDQALYESTVRRGRVRIGRLDNSVTAYVGFLVPEYGGLHQFGGVPVNSSIGEGERSQQGEVAKMPPRPFIVMIGSDLYEMTETMANTKAERGSGSAK